MSDSSTSGCATASDDSLRSRQRFVEALQEHFCKFATGGNIAPDMVMHLRSSNPGGLRMRGVTRHKRTQRYEGHIWESKKQVYLGAYDTEALAGMAHDIMALRCKGLAGATMLNFSLECYTPMLTLIGRLSREEIVAALRDCSKNQSSMRGHHSGAADGGERNAASSLAPGGSQAGSHAAAPTTEGTLASRVRKAGSAAAPVLTVNVRRRVYTAAGSEGGSPMPASPKRLSGKMPPCTLCPPCFPAAAVAAAAASCAFPALSAAGVGFWDCMDAGLELECPMAESQSLIFSASDDAYLFQPPMLSPASSLPISCIDMEHVNGTMLLTDQDHPAGPPAPRPLPPGPPASAPIAAAIQEAAAEAQAQAPDATLGEMEQGKESAAEQLLMRSPPTSPSLPLSRVPPLAMGVPVAPPPTPHVYSGSVLAPSSAQPAIWSDLWPQPSTAATQPRCFQPGRLLPSTACATATAALLANDRLTAPPAPAEPRPCRPGRLVTVLPAAAVPSLPDAAVPATLSLPVRYHNPYPYPYGYPYRHPFPNPCFYSYPQPPSMDAVRAASMATLQQAGLLSPLQWGIGLPSHSQPGPASSACSPFAMYSRLPFPG
ncbi:hypothetical protein D9Q98_003797 [Chlorella vulgaris]|nr:hypothetical protein D9Q98_003797 [Chlorella vulgaris]